MAKDEDFEYEFINDDEMEFAKRGRKAKINAQLLSILEKAPKGKFFKVSQLAIDPKSEKASVKKAAISQELRKHLKMAKWTEFQIKWTTDFVPCVKIIK